MRVALIAALARDGTIGRDGRIPWRLGDDLQRFKRLTWAHPLIMGRRTFESLGRPLPGRTNIVLSRRTGYRVPPGVRVATSFSAALAVARRAEPNVVFVIGGGAVYAEALPGADHLLLTHVHQDITGDTRFPCVDRALWHEIARLDTSAYAFVEYARNPAAPPLAAAEPGLHLSTQESCFP